MTGILTTIDKEHQMQIPLELSFQHLEPEDEIKDYVRERVDYLGQLYDGITSCRVHVALPQHSKQTGHTYDITIEVRVPGTELVVSDRKGNRPERQHLRIALRDAFAIIERDLKIYRQKMRGEVKTLDGMLQGTIAEIRHDRDFGQIQATDRRLIYFHRNSVIDGSFDKLKVGDTVELVARHDDSEIGPQASTVRQISPLKYQP
ncbi:HPF/RaiA family ribosome-associated protein [Maritimibacter fusiformis]|nr:HPF/RaiA family ribosome-associated protein [Maritimibacter fusiformis]